MQANHRVEGTGDPALSEAPAVSKFKSVRRVFRIMDLVSQRGESLTAKELTRELGTNLSSCYYLLNILADEGYIRKISGGGYTIGPTIPLLNKGSRSDFDRRIEPVVKKLAQRAQTHAYAAVLSDGEAVVTQAKAPKKRSYVGEVEGAIGLSATTRRVQSEGQQLIELVQWAATEATTLLVDATYGGRSSA